MTRWGILATGRIAGDFVSDLQLLPDASVAAVGSRTLDAATGFAARFGIPIRPPTEATLTIEPPPRDKAPSTRATMTAKVRTSCTIHSSKKNPRRFFGRLPPVSLLVVSFMIVLLSVDRTLFLAHQGSAEASSAI